MPKKMGSPRKFNDKLKNSIYNLSEGKLTIGNKVSSRNISEQFREKFKKTISYSSYANQLQFKKYGRYIEE